MYSEILDFAKQISQVAGNILLKGFRSEDLVISYKSRTDLLTNIDKESEAYLFEAINKKFPGHRIISEEGSRKETAGEFTWYIDPLDATNNFAHGIPFFCISLGVFSKVLNRVIAGVVFDPYHDELFSACFQGGALLNNDPISVSSTEDLGISVLATGFPYAKEDMANNNLSQFNRFLPLIQGIRRIGSAALDLTYVSCGRIDGFWEPMLHPWDMAAGSLIVEEAGGRVTGYDGGTFDPEIPRILASNGKIHESMIQIING